MSVRSDASARRASPSLAYVRMVTSLSALVPRKRARESGDPMSASADRASGRAFSAGFESSKTRVRSGTASRYLSAPRAMMISLRTFSTLRFNPGSRRSPTDASPIFFRARTDWNRTSGSRSWPRACSSSGIAADPRRMPNPWLAARRMPSSLSLSLARSAVMTDASTGTSGSTTVPACSSNHGLMRLPNFMSAAVGPDSRGRCRLTSAWTERSRMSASLSAESCTKPGSVWMSFISSSASSTWRRTPASGSSVNGSRAGMDGTNFAVPSWRAASVRRPASGFLRS